jgi:hypothetical protein
MEKAEARSFGFSVKRIGVNEQAYQHTIKSRIDYAKNESVKDVADQSAKQLAGAIYRPVQRCPADDWEKREWPGEPTESGVAQSPPHARAIAADVTLKQ